MYKNCIGSNRIYNSEFNELFDKELYDFNRQKYFAYNLYFLYKYNNELFLTKYGDVSLHMIIKNKYKLNDYYTNSILREAKGILDSQIECNKNRVTVLTEHKKQVECKIKKTIKLLNKYIEFRNKLHKYQKDKTKFKSNLPNISIKDNQVEFRYLKNNKSFVKTYGIYEFEYNYLNKRIKTLKARCGNLRYRINNIDNKINKKIKHAVFYKKYLNNKLVYINKKYSELIISGRSDGKYKNFVFKATPVKDKFDLEINFKSKTIKLSLIFKYRGDILNKILVNNIKTPIAYKLVRKIDKCNNIYYQIFAIFDIDIEPRNNYIGDGVIGIDFNYGHLDFTETNEHGNILFTKTINYDITDDSNTNKLNLQKAIKEIAEYAVSKHKLIVIENLDTSKSKNKSVYRNKCTNEIFHTFPYSLYTDLIDYAGVKYGFDIIKVNPFLTSYIGKIKYINKKLNSHVLASFVIARRGMGFKESLPNEFKSLVNIKENHLKQWFSYKKLK